MFPNTGPRKTIKVLWTFFSPNPKRNIFKLVRKGSMGEVTLRFVNTEKTKCHLFFHMFVIRNEHFI